MVGFTPWPLYPQHSTDRELGGSPRGYGSGDNSWPYWDHNSDPSVSYNQEIVTRSLASRAILLQSKLHAILHLLLSFTIAYRTRGKPFCTVTDAAMGSLYWGLITQNLTYIPSEGVLRCAHKPVRKRGELDWPGTSAPGWCEEEENLVPTRTQTPTPWLLCSYPAAT